MNGKQVSIYLDENETRRLLELAERSCRRPNEQARFLLRSFLLGDIIPTSDNTGAESAKTHAGVVSTQQTIAA